jgi:hypothetical protein
MKGFKYCPFSNALLFRKCGLQCGEASPRFALEPAMADGMIERKWQVAFLLATVILGLPYGG